MSFVKLFILGLPGSGKSAIARYLSEYVKYLQVDEKSEQKWTAIRFNDYEILYEKFEQDTTGRFKPAEPGGFDVLDLKVFDEALQDLEQRVNAYIHSLTQEENQLIIIEFSRNNYHLAFDLFHQSFLKGAFFLYLDTSIEKCKVRIHERIDNPRYFDDYPVSEYIFEKYYNDDDGTHIASILAERGIPQENIWIRRNNYPYDVACAKLKPFINRILGSTSHEAATNQEQESESLVDTSDRRLVGALDYAD
jgi:dephospho-CoA kinase